MKKLAPWFVLIAGTLWGMMCNVKKEEYRIMRNKWTKNRIVSIVAMSLCISLLTACGSDDTSKNTAEEQQIVSGNTEQEDLTEAAYEEEVVLKEVIEGDMAPDFTANLADGSTFTLSEKSGKVILLNFWATWCGPCVGEMPAFQDLYEEYGDKIEILAVNSMEDEDTVNQFIGDTGYTFPIAYDVDGTISFTYPSSGIPYTLVIGADGIVKKIYVGAADADTQYQLYKGAIEAALSE